MRKLLAISALLLICNTYVFAGFGTKTAWDIRTAANGGADTNAGGFDSGVASPGTDASQGSGVAFSDLSLTGSGTTATSATLAFSSTTHGPGNFLIIASGSGCTPGTYEMLSQSAGTGTFDASMGSAGSTCTGVFGGSKLTIAATMALIASNNNKVYVKTGTYTLTSTVTMPTAPYGIIGYGSTHGDMGTAPLITTATDSTPLFFTQPSGSNGTLFQNLSLSNTASVRSTGIESRSSSLYEVDHCTLTGFTKALDGDNSGATYPGSAIVRYTEITGSTTYAIQMDGDLVVTDSYIHGNTSAAQVGAVSSTGTHTFAMTRTIVADNTGIGVVMASTIVSVLTGNTIARNSGDNVYINNISSIYDIENNIIYGSTGGYGIDYAQATLPPAMVVYNNAFGANFSGDALAPMTTGVNSISLSVSPFTSSTDFSPNSAAGGGALLKGAGTPGIFPGGLTTGYPDVGAVQSQASAGASAGPYGSIN